MKKQFQLLKRASLLSLLLGVLVVGVAYAITIAVDGTRESAWDGGGSASDPNEGTITNDGVDLERVEWTNDDTNFYILFNTYANTNWNPAGPNDPYIILCIDNDNNDSTGTSIIPTNCPGAGYDRYVQIYGGTSLFVEVYQDDYATLISATTSVSYGGVDITELSIDNASLGLSNSNCGTMPTTVYMDGRTAAPDDNVADSGDIQLNCGAPTAITLDSLSVRNNNNMVVIGVAGVLLLGGAMILLRI
ncbi:MAG TPA: hypothetical protein PK530_24225, partial [Anaerolineales bacterium]|nr:hypothetical protein [Anaerolineales bacterium]